MFFSRNSNGSQSNKWKFEFNTSLNEDSIDKIDASKKIRRDCTTKDYNASTSDSHV